VPFFEEMVSMILNGRGRPTNAEYPQIAEDIHQAIQQVYNGTKQPEEALDEAAAKSARAIGW
jgi:multiple sugar transport system substrate-binding protein